MVITASKYLTSSQYGCKLAYTQNTPDASRRTWADPGFEKCQNYRGAERLFVLQNGLILQDFGKLPGGARPLPGSAPVYCH